MKCIYRLSIFFGEKGFSDSPEIRQNKVHIDHFFWHPDGIINRMRRPCFKEKTIFRLNITFCGLDINSVLLSDDALPVAVAVSVCLKGWGKKKEKGHQ